MARMQQAALLLLTVLLLTGYFNNPCLALDFPPKPSSDSFYVDAAAVISPEDGQEINSICNALLEEESAPLIVVVIKSLADYDAGHLRIETYAQQLFDRWGIGTADRNYGMLLLVSVRDRKARIELGADWRHDHDRDSEHIMQELILPQFRMENYSGGILAGVRGLDAMARGLELPKRQAPWWALPLFIGLIGLAIGVIISLFKSGRSGWGWALIALLGFLLWTILSSSAKSGSSGSFGGGFSGGGGASGSW